MNKRFVVGGVTVVVGICAMTLRHNAESQAMPASRRDVCQDVLLIGLRDQFQSSRFASVDEMARTIACDASRQQSSGSANVGFVVPGIDMPLELSGAGEYTSWQSHCSDASWFQRRVNSEWIVSSALSPHTPHVIRAWQDCLSQSTQVGPFAEIVNLAPRSAAFQIRIGWVNPLQRSLPPARLTEFTVAGATCSGAFPARMRMLPARDVSCQRDSARTPVVVTVNSTDGPVSPSPVIPAMDCGAVGQTCCPVFRAGQTECDGGATCSSGRCVPRCVRVVPNAAVTSIDTSSFARGTRLQVRITSPALRVSEADCGTIYMEPVTIAIGRASFTLTAQANGEQSRSTVERVGSDTTLEIGSTGGSVPIELRGAENARCTSRRQSPGLSLRASVVEVGVAGTLGTCP